MHKNGVINVFYFRNVVVLAMSKGQKKGEGWQLLWVNSGVWWKKGVANPQVWAAVQSKMDSHQDWTNQELVASLFCSISMVEKVKWRLRSGE